MPTNRTRANYDELNKIAQQWTQQEQATRQMLTSLRQCMDALQGGDWVGQGANAFYAEMTSTVLPSLNRLADALGAARRTTIAIRAAVQQAEADAAAVLRDDGADYSKAGSKGRGLASLQTSSSTDGNAKNLVDSGAGNSANPGLPTMKHNKDTPVFKTPPAGAQLVVGGVSVRDVKLSA